MTPMDNDRVALFDLDGTLADYNTAIYRDLKKIRSPGEDLYEIYNDNLPEWYFARIKMIRRVPGWWENLGKIELGFQLLEAAIETGFMIHVLTKGPGSKVDDDTDNIDDAASWSEKLRWCRKHLPSSACVTVTEDKGLVYGRVLVDDFPDYQMKWLEHRPRGLAVVPACKNNEWFNADSARRMAESKGWDHEPQVIRYDGHNLTEVLDAMQAAYERASKEPLSVVPSLT